MVLPRKWVLVVEDRDELRTAWVRELERAGYAAVGAADAVSASELTRVLMPDLIVLDPEMPGVSEWDVLADLRTSPWQRIPVVIVSGGEGGAGARMPTGLSVVARLGKPVRPSALVATVGRLLGSGASAR